MTSQPHVSPSHTHTTRRNIEMSTITEVVLEPAAQKFVEATANPALPSGPRSRRGPKDRRSGPVGRVRSRTSTSKHDRHGGSFRAGLDPRPPSEGPAAAGTRSRLGPGAGVGFLPGLENAMSWRSAGALLRIVLEVRVRPNHQAIASSRTVPGQTDGAVAGSALVRAARLPSHRGECLCARVDLRDRLI